MTIQLLSFSSSRTLKKKYVAEFSLPFHGFQEYHVVRPEQHSACTMMLCRILVGASILEDTGIDSQESCGAGLFPLVQFH